MEKIHPYYHTTPAGSHGFVIGTFGFVRRQFVARDCSGYPTMQRSGMRSSSVKPVTDVLLETAVLMSASLFFTTRLHPT